VRRLVIVLLSLAIAVVVVVLAIRARGDRPPAGSADVGDAVVDDESVAAVADVKAELVSLASASDHPAEEDGCREGERMLAEMTRLRADVVAGVDRRPLFAMAQARGLPNHELFVMSSQQLLEAILDAEGLPPEDVLPSAQSVERIRAIADEAFRRQVELAAEEAAERDAG
jgi:hypothetical protein